MRTTDRDAKVRVLQGSTSATGTGYGGPGWQGTRNGVSDYTIRFTPPFAATPSISIVGVTPGVNGFARVIEAAADHIRFYMISDTGAANDCAAFFIVRGMEST
jgi:hypothetical protein